MARAKTKITAFHCPMEDRAWLDAQGAANALPTSDVLRVLVRQARLRGWTLAGGERTAETAR